MLTFLALELVLEPLEGGILNRRALRAHHVLVQLRLVEEAVAVQVHALEQLRVRLHHRIYSEVQTYSIAAV